ncbi:MAG: 2-oxoglutarate ferredoxin oxidoreductase subunit alpha [Gemmatimonadota bacterium]|nr:MAG: 2-oxoglutarate ferredoxin oxidoreductase subunit alpha [Gemmatimonadota bacterium]
MDGSVKPASKTAGPAHASAPRKMDQQIVEIVSDSGEGAQKAGQTFGAISAKMGNGVWTVEIIPAEIKPPARSRAGASGIRIRLGTGPITNMGDEADLVVALNEQVLFGRIEQGAYKPGTVVLLENKWGTDPVDHVRAEYAEAVTEFRTKGLVVYELPLEEACRGIMPNPRLGKNMFVLGMLSRIYQRDLELALAEVELVFKRKGAEVVQKNREMVEAGYRFATENVDVCVEIPAAAPDQAMVVMNGNQAVGLGVMASGMETVAMYPITPATSASHYLAGSFPKVGGIVHQAEDEIAAIGFAIGASYAGKTACTITSGPGLALKTEFIGLAVMAEIPLVLVVVQRGGPSTGLPTKVEQGELLPAIFGSPGDDPKIVFSAATIEECFHFVVLARKLAEEFRGPVVLLTDANLATGVQPFPRPEPREDWLAAPLDLSAWNEDTPPYDWDPVTGLSPRPIPGQAGGEYVLTGLAHTRQSKVAYDPFSNQLGCEMRSRKLAALRRSLKPPAIRGNPEGDLLVVGWGSTLGAIDEAVDRAQAEGHAVSSIHLRFLAPLEPGLAEIFAKFKQVVCVEINYSDPPDAAPFQDPSYRRLSQLAKLLRNRTLVDVDSWSNVHGQPLRPGQIHDEIVRRTTALQGEKSCTN